MTRRIQLLIWAFWIATTVLPQEGLKLKHPLPDYSVYADFEITAMANRIRASRPQYNRGGILVRESLCGKIPAMTRLGSSLIETTLARIVFGHGRRS